ncbi:MAG TPA: tetraacyldisaccharide 4'-kinase [Gemmataceae bacterium]|nr:tetraacyldisaccharide 4'-kinase [Gemmataceae bacterium]
MARRSERWTANYLALIGGHPRGLGASLLRSFLFVSSWLYGRAIWLRNRCFDWGWKQRVEAAVPVISVGNLTVGGTGKTPCVEYIARFLQAAGLRVAILSRGYRSAGGPNDEALLLAENLSEVPHFQGADRAALAAKAVAEFGSEVLILDDGFQHRRLNRALDIVLVDATQTWGFGHLLPRGLLREPPRELRRANVVLLTHCDQVNEKQKSRLRLEIERLAPGVPIIETEHQPLEWLRVDGQTLPLNEIGGPAAAFCGIGNPASFRKTLESIGISIQAFRTFPDHHHYDRASLEELESWARALSPHWPLLTTQKDLVKLRRVHLANHDLWALRIGLFIQKGEETLRQLLLNAAPVAAPLSI